MTRPIRFVLLLFTLLFLFTACHSPDPSLTTNEGEVAATESYPESTSATDQTTLSPPESSSMITSVPESSVTLTTAPQPTDSTVTPTTAPQPTDSTLPAKPEDPAEKAAFRELAEELISNCGNNLFNAASPDWFSGYNGEALQRIDVAETGKGAAQISDIIFYTPSGNETMNEVLRTMITALVEPMFEPSDDRPFTVTEFYWYQIIQKRYDAQKASADLIDLAWKNWQNSESDGDMTECIWQTLGEALAETGLFPLDNSDNMWLLPSLAGYYRYDGVDTYSFADYLAANKTAVKDGMLPFVREGEACDFVYLLVKKDGTYRLQRLVDMAVDLQRKYLEETPKEEPPFVMNPVFTEKMSPLIDRYLAKLEARKADWYATYNGEQTQTIITGPRHKLLTTDITVFYRAEEGEDLRSVLSKMLDAWTAPFLVRDDTGYMITSYQWDTANQLITPAEEAQDRFLKTMYTSWNVNKPENLEQFVVSAIEGAAVMFGDALIGEEMWLIPAFRGNYEYEGTQTSKKWSWPYILIREGNVYRLQNGEYMDFASLWTE